MLRADINLYQNPEGEAISFSAVGDGSSNISSQGAYDIKNIPLILSDFLKRSDVKAIYLRSIIPPFSGFRKVGDGLLAQVGGSLKKQGIEAEIIFN